MKTKLKTLGDVCENISRPFDFSNYQKVVFVNTGDVLDGKFLHKDYSEKEGLPGQAKKAIQREDILFSEIRPINKRFAFVDEDCDEYVVSTKFMVLRSNDDVIPKYLYHYLKCDSTLKNLQREAESRSGTFPQITFDAISYFSIPIPSKKEQERISAFIDNIEKQIELNKQMNENLEEIAKTLFKSWFLDFDPVRAKAEGRPTGLSKEISDLFPDSFEDSKLGEIPTGWSVNNISKNLETTIGGTPSRKNKDFWEGEIEWINSGKLNDFPLNSCSEYISEAAVKNSSTKLAKRHSTLVGMVTEIGKDLITFSDRDFYINQSIVAIQPDDSIFPEFVYLYLRANSKRLYMEQSGGAQQHINKGIVNDFKILLPDQNSLEKFKPYFGDIFSKICLNSKQNIYLEEIRDLLLPKLISGELKITDAENLIEEADI